MPQISVVGSGGDYSTIAEWEAAESGSDYGAGNPAIAEITGTLNESTTISGAFIRGCIIRAKAGEEYDPVTNTGAGNLDQFRPSITTSGVTARFENIFVGKGVLCYGSASVELDGCTVERPSSGQAFNDNGAPAMWAYNTLFRNCARAFDGPSGDTNYGCTNCTSVNVTGSFSFVRGVFINCFTLDKGFAATTTGSDYNASTDTTAPGANSLTSRTTADVVDYAGGDYRTASGSALATGGNGTDAAHIGYALEAAGGNSQPLTLEVFQQLNETALLSFVQYQALMFNAQEQLNQSNTIGLSSYVGVDTEVTEQLNEVTSSSLFLQNILELLVTEQINQTNTVNINQIAGTPLTIAPSEQLNQSNTLSSTQISALISEVTEQLNESNVSGITSASAVILEASEQINETSTSIDLVHSEKLILVAVEQYNESTTMLVSSLSNINLETVEQINESLTMNIGQFFYKPPLDGLTLTPISQVFDIKSNEPTYELASNINKYTIKEIH